MGRALCGAVLAVTLFAPQPAYASDSVDRITQILLPDDPLHIVLASAASGIFQSRDGGATWDPEMAGVPR